MFRIPAAKAGGLVTARAFCSFSLLANVMNLCEVLKYSALVKFGCYGILILLLDRLVLRPQAIHIVVSLD